MTRTLARRAFLISIGAVLFNSGTARAVKLDVVELNPPQPTTHPDRIVVTEFFSYQCPHCAALDPTLRLWVDKLADDVVFERIPVSLGRKAWEPIAKTFFTLRTMHELDSLDTAIFRAIHIDGARLTDKSSIVDWVRQSGIDGERFSEMYDSFGVDVALRSGEQIARAHRVYSIPALSIDGRYLVVIADSGGPDREADFASQLAEVGRLIEPIRTDKQP